MSEIHNIFLIFVEYRIAFWGILISVVTSVLYACGRPRGKAVVPEPPCVPAKIPIPQVGHLIGIMRRRIQYCSDIGVAYRKPIAKIPVLGTNIYVVGSAKMIPHIQRQSRTLSARTWFAKFVCALVGCSKRSMHKFKANLHGTSTGDSLLLEGVKITKRILSSQTGTQMNYEAARSISNRFREIQTPNYDQELDLFQWIKHEMFHVVSEAAYGSNNPFWDPKVESAFWEFENDTLALCMGSFLPQFIVSRFVKGFKGRETVVKAFDDYFKSGCHFGGSAVVNAHYPLWKAGLDESDIARFECASALGASANLIPTAFWTIFHVFANPQTLAEIRSQVSAVTTTAEPSEAQGMVVRLIDLRRLRAETMVFSAVEEASRHRASGVGVRLVTQDTVIGEGDDRYYLKKGGWLVVANKALHTDKAIWGEDADRYVARRFTRKVPSLSFRGFGNGATACCGKNLALYHIGAFLAIMVMRYDITPVGGVWKEPGQDGRDSASQVCGPAEKVIVRMTLREDAAKVAWDFSF